MTTRISRNRLVKRTQRDRLVRVTLVVGTWSVYILLFLAYYPSLGLSIASLSMVPVLMTAWFYGRWAGLLAGLLLLPLTMSLGIASKVRDLIDLLNQSLPGYAMAIIAGFAFGWARDTGNELKLQIAERQKTDEALRRSLAQLEARNEELDAFAHTVAHDLKTSITVIFIYADLLLDDHSHFSAEDARSFLQIIASGSQKMAHVVDELLLLAKVRRADVPIIPLDMTAVVNEALVRLQSTMVAERAQIEQPLAWPTAMGHAPWVEEVWVNYISNALKYGGRPPRIVLGATAEEHMVRFWVRDNGPGLSPGDHSQLFTAFTQLHQDGAGHGLGLSIVRRIVEQLGGQVGVEDNDQQNDGTGSTFYFTLPTTLQPPAGQQPGLWDDAQAAG